jgi:hypothetical protein
VSAALAEAVVDLEWWRQQAGEAAVAEPELMIDEADLARAVLDQLDGLFDEIRTPVRRW